MFVSEVHAYMDKFNLKGKCQMKETMSKAQKIYTGVSFVLAGVQLGIYALDQFACKKAEKIAAEKNNHLFESLETALYQHFKPIVEKELGLENVHYAFNPHQKGHLLEANRVLGATGPALLRKDILVVELYRQGIAHEAIFTGLGKFDLEKYAMNYVNTLAHELRHVKQFTLEGYNFDSLDGTIFSKHRGVRKEVEKVAKAYGNQFAKQHREEILRLVKEMA